MQKKVANARITIIGLGYVGLPLAVEFAKKYRVIGFDLNESRVMQISSGYDRTMEVDEDILKKVLLRKNYSTRGLSCTSHINDIEDCNFYIVAVPTPVDKSNCPDLTHLRFASQLVGGVLKKGDTVIFESTVYPGATEEECVPIMEKFSNLSFNQDFFVGYSPERINPGNSKYKVTNVVKLTSGSTPDSALVINTLYSSIIKAGTFPVSSIKIAEAAKVIENAQRDINIAFVNELAKIFNLLNIDTKEVLDAAGTKWNFLNFTPGLVGGHCIGVDPYYLAHKAQEVGYNPEIILAGRRVNHEMGSYVADEVVRLMLREGIKVSESSALILGITFKENCADVRNTKVIDIIKRLTEYKVKATIYDPLADESEVKKAYNVNHKGIEALKDKYDSVILAVAHDLFRDINLRLLTKEPSVVFDVKSMRLKVYDN